MISISLVAAETGRGFRQGEKGRVLSEDFDFRCEKYKRLVHGTVSSNLFTLSVALHVAFTEDPMAQPRFGAYSIRPLLQWFCCFSFASPPLPL